MVPALGYLAFYERLIEKSRLGKLTTAEMHFLLNKFDAAELHLYEQARNLSISLLEDWLTRYKFKDWKRTEARKLKVTDEMRAQRAREIAEKLNETETWNSHGRGISMAVLRDRLNLRIDDFGQIPLLNEKIRQYYTYLADYTERREYVSVIQSSQCFRAF